MHTSLLDYALHKYPNLAWALQQLQGLEHINHIAQAIQQGNCAMISDGSFYPTTSQAAGAWLLGNEALHRQISGSAPSVGPKECQSAYRGELSGLYGGILLVKCVCDYRQITRGHILIGCDGLGALQRIQKKPSLSSNHFDYVSAIQNLVKDLPISYRFTHVKGHLDDSIDLDHLSIVEKMNVHADILAKQANNQTFDFTHIETLPLYKEYGPINIHSSSQSKKISSTINKSLYAKLTKSPTRSYWKKKLHISPSASKCIAWKNLSAAFSSLPQLKKLKQ